MALIASAFTGDTVQAPATSSPFQMTASRTLPRHYSFAERLANADTCNYLAKHANTGQWEFGLGTWNSTTLQLTRTTILATDAVLGGGSARTFDGGNVEVVITRSATFWS